MLRTALRFLVRATVVVGVAASFGTGCSRQAEGERCDYTWAGDQDCDDGLICTPCGRLQQQTTDRCCLPSGYTDTRCIPTTSPTETICSDHQPTDGTGGTDGSGTGGTGGTGGTTGEAGNGATSGTGATDGD